MCCSVGLEHNFQKYTHAQLDRLEAPYDMKSVMHLPRKAFSKNGLNTMEARAGSYIPLGGSDDLSEIDKAQLNLLYSCTGYPSKYSLPEFVKYKRQECDLNSILIFSCTTIFFLLK